MRDDAKPAVDEQRRGAARDAAHARIERHPVATARRAVRLVADGALGEAALVERQHAVLAGLGPPPLDEAREHVRMLACDVAALREIAIEPVELPRVLRVRTAPMVERDGLPTVVPDRAMREHLEILCVPLARRVRLA